MICSVMGELTERLTRHDNYGHFGAKKQFHPGLSRQLQNWGHQSTTPSLGLHNRLIIELKPTLDGNCSWRLIFLPSPLSRVYDAKTRAGHLRGGIGLGQILHLPNFNNIGDPIILLTRGLSNNRKLDTSHTKPSLRSVPNILPANHNNIIRLFQVIYDSTISLRQYEIPWVVNRVFVHTTRKVDSTQQHLNPAVCEEFPLSKQRIPYITLHTTDSRVNRATTKSDAVKVQLKSGYLFYRTTLK